MELPAELWARAEESGVSIQRKDCSLCGAEGAFATPDPLDLRRLREAKGYTKTSFAKQVRKPDGSRVTIGFVHMVENPNPQDHNARRCPDWLLAQYLSIPPAAETAPKKGPKRKEGEALAAAQEFGRKILVVARARKAAKLWRERELQRMTPPKMGSIWRMKRNPERVVEVAKVIWPTILYRVQGNDDGPLRSIGARSFLGGYEEISK